MNNSNPLVTVYVPSHNYGHYLKYAVESVLRQTYPNWELLLVDDNSTDSTQEVINIYKGDPRIRSFKTEGLGLIGVCNLALKEAKGEYLVRLDADDIFDENILLVLATHLINNPKDALVFPDYFLVDEFGEIYLSERRKKIYDSNHLLDMPPNGACTMIRKEVLLKVGGYNSELGAQDGLDIWRKIASEHKSANINLPLFYYRRHDSNLTNTSQRILEARRQIKKTAIKDDLENYTPVTAVIPCRRNYDFVSDLWSMKFSGITLMERAIFTCLNSPLIDNVVVTCDNPEAEEIVSTIKDPRLSFLLRKPEDTIRSHSIVPTLEKVSEEKDPQLKGLTILCYAQAPFVTTETLEEAIATLIMNEADSSFGVETIDKQLFRRSSFGLEALNKRKNIVSDFDTIYSEAQVFLVTKSSNFKSGSLTGPKIANFIVDSEEVFFIDTSRKLQIASILDIQQGVVDSAKELSKQLVR